MTNEAHPSDNTPAQSPNSDYDGHDLTRNGYNGPPPQPTAEIKPTEPPPSTPKEE